MGKDDSHHSDGYSRQPVQLVHSVEAMADVDEVEQDEVRSTSIREAFTACSVCKNAASRELAA